MITGSNRFQPRMVGANPGSPGCGCVIRDYIERWIAGFAIHIGTCPAFTVELWGILKGLEVAFNKALRKNPGGI